MNDQFKKSVMFFIHKLALKECERQKNDFRQKIVFENSCLF